MIDLRVGVSLAVGLCALDTREPSLDGGTRPPSSLQPERAVVRFEHRHLVAKACRSEGRGAERRCHDVLESGDPSTSLRLLPVQERRLRSARDEREPVDVTIGNDGTPSGGDVLVEPGTWEIDWSGAGKKSLSLEEAGAVRVDLRTVSGRCERTALDCALRPRSVTKTIDVSVP